VVGARLGGHLLVVEIGGIHPPWIERQVADELLIALLRLGVVPGDPVRPLAARLRVDVGGRALPLAEGVRVVGLDQQIGTAALERDPDPGSIYAPWALGSGEVLERRELLAAPLRSVPRPTILEAPITKLRGAGPKLAAAAAEIGISDLGDLLWHVPHRYRDR